MEKARDPEKLLKAWLKEALGLKMHFPHHMVLSTASPFGRPSGRVVLLKGLSKGGLHFYSNYESRKGGELRKNPQAALCFYWDALGRQIRVEGKVSRLSRAESLRYFHTRPRGSQIGAWASIQSEEIPDRKFLETRVKELEKRFQGKPIPLPPFWGGFALQPQRFEFWQLGEFRLHDRFSFEKKRGRWVKKRLSP